LSDAQRNGVPKKQSFAIGIPSCVEHAAAIEVWVAPKKAQSGEAGRRNDGRERKIASPAGVEGRCETRAGAGGGGGASPPKGAILPDTGFCRSPQLLVVLSLQPTVLFFRSPTGKQLLLTVHWKIQTNANGWLIIVCDT